MHGHVGMGIERGSSVIFTSSVIHYHSPKISFVKGYDFYEILRTMIEPSKGEQVKEETPEPLSTYHMLASCTAPIILGHCRRYIKTHDKTQNYQ